MADPFTNATKELSESLVKSLWAIESHVERDLRRKLTDIRRSAFAFERKDPHWVAFDSVSEVRNLLENSKLLLAMSEQDNHEGWALSRELAKTAFLSRMTLHEEIVHLSEMLLRLTPLMTLADELHRILVRSLPKKVGFMLPSERGIHAPLDKLWRGFMEVDEPRGLIELFLEKAHELSANDLYWGIMLDRELHELAEETRVASEATIVRLESQLILH